jgi:hypothetical protein
MSALVSPTKNSRHYVSPSTNEGKNLRRRKVIESDPIGVIAIYELVLDCGHKVTFLTKSNRVPKTVTCKKCKRP